MTPTRLTLGTAQLGMPYGIANGSGTPSAKDTQAIFERAWSLGIRSFDTAPGYGEAEVRLGAFLRGVPRSEVCVTTKASGDLVGSIQGSLARLGIDAVDHLLLHDPSELSADASLRSLSAILDRGLARSVGASTYSVSDARLVAGLSALRTIQVPLNLLDQRLVASSVIDELSGRGVTVFARSVFLQGLFSLDPSALPARVAHAKAPLEALRALCRKYGTTPLAAALPFALAVPGVSSVVIGVDTISQLDENVRASDASFAELSQALPVAFASVPLDVVDPSRWS